MSTLVTGTFQWEQQAAQAVRKLVESCVPMDFVRTILPAARKRLASRQQKGGHAAKEPSGIMVAVNAPKNVAQRLAVKILRDHGAREIQCIKAPGPVSPRARTRASERGQ